MNPPPRPMAPADHAWLRMDCPENLVVIHLAFVFEGELPLEAVAQRLHAQLKRHHQFTHRVQRGWWRAWWMADEAFAIFRDSHDRRSGPRPFLVHDDGGLPAFHDGDDGVGRPEVDSDDFVWHAEIIGQV